MFCSKCKRLLNISEGIGKCSCGNIQIMKDGYASATESMPAMKKKGEGAVKDENLLATFPHECPKCGYDKAQVIDLGVWYGDEGGVVRYKCGKCGYTVQDKGSNT